MNCRIRGLSSQSKLAATKPNEAQREVAYLHWAVVLLHIGSSEKALRKRAQCRREQRRRSSHGENKARPIVGTCGGGAHNWLSKCYRKKKKKTDERKKTA